MGVHLMVRLDGIDVDPPPPNEFASAPESTDARNFEAEGGIRMLKPRTATSGELLMIVLVLELCGLALCTAAHVVRAVRRA